MSKGYLIAHINIHDKEGFEKFRDTVCRTGAMNCAAERESPCCPCLRAPPPARHGRPPPPLLPAAGRHHGGPAGQELRVRVVAGAHPRSPGGNTLRVQREQPRVDGRVDALVDYGGRLHVRQRYHALLGAR